MIRIVLLAALSIAATGCNRATPYDDALELVSREQKQLERCKEAEADARKKLKALLDRKTEQTLDEVRTPEIRSMLNSLSQVTSKAEEKQKEFDKYLENHPNRNAGEDARLRKLYDERNKAQSEAGQHSRALEEAWKAQLEETEKTVQAKFVAQLSAAEKLIDDCKKATTEQEARYEQACALRDSL